MASQSSLKSKYFFAEEFPSTEFQFGLYIKKKNTNFFSTCQWIKKLLHLLDPQSEI